MSSKVWDEITYPFPTSTAAPLKFGNGLVISSQTLYDGRNHLPILELKYIHINKKNPWREWWTYVIYQIIRSHEYAEETNRQLLYAQLAMIHLYIR